MSTTRSFSGLRRKLLAFMLSAPLASRAIWAGANANAMCIAKPERTEGPYFVDHQLNRNDIRLDPVTHLFSPGVPLILTMDLLNLAKHSCEPLAGATVDVWHCDAQGVYSGVSDMNTLGKKFLRGYQVSDHAGRVTFKTIYPGWYPGRAVHIHFKVRTRNDAGKSYEFTSQLFFDDRLSDAVFLQAPYKRPEPRDTRNARDMLYGKDGGQLLLTPVEKADGYHARISVALDLSDDKVGAPDGFSMPLGADGRPMPPPPGPRPPQRG
ncbi:intradiol ring-cleavage dioxygenase [Methylovorus menthalis]|uniref:intradiol ring-cleavage dioxygenase n=1 Tax=Methylovorus menthalis TaxID=1002227 RepID=UPI001E2F9C1B|nr:intradiol ring-cleavage dioxygenase [Methylovorus menthalis]MCB4811833.1 intradiol ring-cleavage dioxygenase [Methylovorus menthalis]